MNQQSKFSSGENQQSRQQQNKQTAPLEFASPEEMLRYDAAQTPAPPEIGERLRNSLGDLKPPRQSWWRRWFGK